MRIALAVHVLAVAGWVGGMAFALFALRPALGLLAPPVRLGVMARVFARFLPAAGVAVVAVLASGAAMIAARGGLSGLPAGVHAMIGLGLVMSVVYAYVVFVPWPRLRAAVASEAWPVAGAAAESIRRAVLLNLALGVVAIVAAFAGGPG